MRVLNEREVNCYEYILGLLNGAEHIEQIIEAIDDLVTLLLGGAVNECENY